MASKSSWLVAVQTPRDGLKSWTEPDRQAAFDTKETLLKSGIKEEIYIFRLTLANGRLFVERKGGGDRHDGQQRPEQGQRNQDAGSRRFTLSDAAGSETNKSTQNI